MLAILTAMCGVVCLAVADSFNLAYLISGLLGGVFWYTLARILQVGENLWLKMTNDANMNASMKKNAPATKDKSRPLYDNHKPNSYRL